MGMTVTEFAFLAPVGGSAQAPIPMQPPIAVQTAVTISGTSAQSAAFNSATRFIEVSVDVASRILVGTNPTATANNTYLAAGAIYHCGVIPGQKIAVIAA